MADPKDKWTRPLAPPAPMFFGKKERDLVKQINDELAERVLGQTIAYYPISLEESNFNDTYGESKEKVSLPPIRVFAYVEVDNEQTNKTFGYEYQTKLKVYFSERRLTEDQNLYVRVGDFVQYGEFFYEIVKTFDDTRYYFGQVEHKFQIAAECVRARTGTFRVMPSVDRPTTASEQAGDPDNPAPRPAPYPPLAASYVTMTADSKLPNERVLTAGAGITISDGGANSTVTITAAGQNATGPAGSIQLQAGSGIFAGNANLTFLTASGPVGRLGIGTDAPTHELTVIGDVSASADVHIGGNLRVKGILLGASPLKISGSIQIIEGGEVVMSLGDIAGDGVTALSASAIAVSGNLDVGQDISASYYYGDARYLTGVTASATEVADGPVGSLQFRVNTPISREISGSANVLYNSISNHLIVDSGLIHARTEIVTSHTASTSEYFLAVTGVPTAIELNATLFAAGQVLVIKDESGNASIFNTILLDPSGSQTIDGESAAHIESPYGSVLIYSNGTNWLIY